MMRCRQTAKQSSFRPAMTQIMSAGLTVLQSAETKGKRVGPYSPDLLCEFYGGIG